MLDSRGVPRGSLFVALPGANHDGHDFVSRAAAGGAGGALIMRENVGDVAEEICLILVDDTTRALQALGAAWRKHLGIPVVGIAGSNGKTTTKESLAAVLSADAPTHATPGNANSQVGSPLAILHTPDETARMVLELGTSAPGELARIARMASPDHAIITAAFGEHLEFLRDIDGVIAEETTILDVLPAGALALVGSAEPRLVTAARSRTHIRVESLGERDDDDWRIEGIEIHRDGTRFSIARRDGSARLALNTPLLGSPAAWAGAFAAIVGRELGVDDAAIVVGLQTATPAAHRLVAVDHATRPVLIIDDCYNSNPAASLAAIEATLALHQGRDRLILVLGDMLELGDAAESAHREVGRAAAEMAPHAERIVCVGELATLLGESARAAGARVSCVADVGEAAKVLRPLLDGDETKTLLLKASRGLALESLVEI